MAPDLEERVAKTARQIAALGEGESTSVYRMSWASGRLLDRAMANDAFRTRLLRFVDVFPVLDGDEDVARHLEEHLDGDGVP
ncbi:MAG: hypothetical protein GXY13_13685, partial [Acidimicrobiales bacterium]|nr:hypothetical protein [Acidimicrobiales bacterium]